MPETDELYQRATLRLEKISALAGEHFDDYLLVVRSNGELRWRSSDPTFVRGSVERILDRVREQDIMETRES